MSHSRPLILPEHVVFLACQRRAGDNDSETVETHADDLVVHLFEVTMNFGSIDRQSTEWLSLVARLDDRSIRETLCLGDEVDLDVRDMVTHPKSRLQHPFGIHRLPLQATSASCQTRPFGALGSSSSGLKCQGVP